MKRNLLKLVFMSATLLFSCGKTKKVCLKVNGIENGTPFLVSKQGANKDTVFSGVVSDKICLDLSTKKESEFPYFYNIKFGDKGTSLIINSGDNIEINFNEETKEFNIKSDFENKMNDFLNKNSEISSLKEVIKSKSNEIKNLRKEYKNALADNKVKAEEIGFKYEKISGEIDNYSDSIIALIYSNILKKPTKNIEDLFVYGEYMYSGNTLKSLDKLNQAVDLFKDYQKTFNIDYISNTLTYFNGVEEFLQNAEKVKVGNDMIDIEELGLDRKTTLKLSDVVKDHKVVLLKFWASWCGPCIRSLPSTVELYKKYGKKGFQVFAVSLDKTDKEAEWKKAIEEHKIGEWIHVSNLKFWDTESRKKYAVRGIPAEFLIVDGKIASNNYISQEEKEGIIKNGLGIKK